VLSTARYPSNEITQACASCPEVITVTYPEKVSYYVDLQRRTVTAGDLHYIYLRVYNGTQLSDDTLFPATLELRSYLIQRPTALAARQCAGSDPRNDTTLCYDFRDFQITQAVFTDPNGYATFLFMANAKYRGLYRVVFTVGASSSGANFFTQSVEIEVVGLASTDDCSTALQAIGTAPKAFQRFSDDHALSMAFSLLTAGCPYRLWQVLGAIARHVVCMGAIESVFGILSQSNVAARGWPNRLCSAWIQIDRLVPSASSRR
jgi:hypothetical protein